tara:strand:- start:3195 stop:4217 length:1023 start_codon:yes stop_codon:yes gene_type:complete
MAFLDNSGDIILDAVLTDLGREKMASGDFSVKYFALGDDEIDYSLYNKNHPSGSAYYDLEILQTPVFEAFTQTNSSINYGLLETTATDLLYLPVLKINDKSAVQDVSMAQSPSTTAGSIGVIWITDTQNDTSTVQIFARIQAAATALDDSILYGSSTARYLMIEGGLDTTSIKGTKANVLTYLQANGLMEPVFNIYYDNRFINTVYGNTTADSFTQDSTGTPEVSYVAKAATSTSLEVGLENYSTAKVSGFSNAIVYDTSYTTADTDVSAIAGPRNGGIMLSFAINPNLDTEYSLYGKLGKTNLLPGGAAVDIIDTTVYVQGRNTGAMVQIPLRIARVPD